MTASILIIDDSKEFQRLLELRLKSFIPDANILKASTLNEACELLSSPQAPQLDLVILDHHLPDGSGLTLLEEPGLSGLAVLAVSSDDDPGIPGQSIRAGAMYFLAKNRVSEALFQPLILGLVDRNRVQRELDEFRRKATIVDTVRTLVGTLRHEINNPLGAVLGAAYILKSQESASDDLKEAARLVEESGRRIKHVLDELTDAVALDEVLKASHKVFHIPGDKPWDLGSES
jgi:CheY-like chemotaxis protein